MPTWFKASNDCLVLARRPVHLPPPEEVNMDVINWLTCKKTFTLILSCSETYYKSNCQWILRPKINYLLNNGDGIQTSTGSIIDHNSEAIIEAFLFGNKLGCVKESAKNVNVPLLSLESNTQSTVRICQITKKFLQPLPLNAPPPPQAKEKKMLLLGYCKPAVTFIVQIIIWLSRKVTDLHVTNSPFFLWH